MKFDYGTQLSPFPIVLSIGTLVKPKLKDIAGLSGDMSFDRFNYFEALVKLTPETFYTMLKGSEGKKYWKSLPQSKKDNMSLYDIVINDNDLLHDFLDIFNFFFKENVIFDNGYFILLKDGIRGKIDIMSQDDIRGVITEKIFDEVLYAIQQICCIDDKTENIDDVSFKNQLAKKLYNKMKKAKRNAKKKADKNLTLPNIISAVSNKHPSINPVSVWDMTVFQLLDSFNRLQVNAMYDIDSIRVSVWGDENKKFNATLWYKNEYDKK